MGAGRWVMNAAVAAGEVGDGFWFARELGRRASSGASGAKRGLAGAHRVGIAGRRGQSAQTLIGADGGAFHSDSDRSRAMAILDLAFAGFRADVEPWATTIAAPASRRQWWTADALPVLSDWALFRDHESSWVGRMATEWSTYEAWLTVLRGLRSGARTQGLALSSPEPERLPETIFERGAAGRGGKLEAAWTIGKTLLYTAIGFAGVAGIYTVWRDVRAGMAPRQSSED